MNSEIELRKWTARNGAKYKESLHSNDCNECIFPQRSCSKGIFDGRPLGCSIRGTVWKKDGPQEETKKVSGPVECIAPKKYSSEELEAFEQLLKIPSIFQIFQIRLNMAYARPKVFNSEWAIKELRNATASQVRMDFNWTNVNPLHVLSWMKEHWLDMNAYHRSAKEDNGI